MNTKFTVGQKVRLIDCRDVPVWAVGAVGTVVEVLPEEIYMISFASEVARRLGALGLDDYVSCFDTVLEAV
jgi:hypothetical protein